MNVLLELVAAITGLVSLICWIIILVDAFKDAVWKGLLFFLCGLYGLYYALFEFEHENKWAIVLVGLFGGAMSAAILQLAR